MVLAVFFAAMAAYVGWITLKGFRSGTMESITRGFGLMVERGTQTRWFCTATLWNGMLVGLCLWGAVASIIDR
tara:strand:+ start:1511 stop:1729 length:219 start_codon:yes stop_codon:yes gene_type:complete